MKKFFVIILLLIIPTVVLADAGGPSIVGYDAVVINKKGAKSQDEGDKTVVKYNTKIYVYDEYDNYVYACLDKNKTIDCEKYVSLKKSDVAPAKKEITPNDLKKVEELSKEKNDIIVVNKNGIKLSKGPAELFGKYDTTIPYETVLHSTYSISTFHSWYYIDGDGYKGWLELVGDDFAILSNSGIITYGDVELKDKDGNTVITVPSETEFKEAFIKYSGVVYLKYDGKSGYAELSKKFIYGYKDDDESYGVTLEKVNIVSIDGEIRGTIPSGKEIKYLYYPYFEEHAEYEEKDLNNYYYIQYDGIKGFIHRKNVYGIGSSGEKIELTEEKAFYKYDAIYEDLEDNETVEQYLNKLEKIGTIPKSASVIVYDEESHYEDDSKRDIIVELVTYKGKIGCMISVKEYDNEPTPTPEPSTSPIVTIPPSSAPKPNVKEKSNNMILYCIIGGVLLAIAAIGTIIVINKKRKKKETFMGEPVKEEIDNKLEEKIEHHDEEINETKEESLPEDQNIEKEDEENKEE